MSPLTAFFGREVRTDLSGIPAGFKLSMERKLGELDAENEEAVEQGEAKKEQKGGAEAMEDDEASQSPNSRAREQSNPCFGPSSSAEQAIFAEHLAVITLQQFAVFLRAFDKTTRVQCYNASLLTQDLTPAFKVSH
jgi:hypothetical protein